MKPVKLISFTEEIVMAEYPDSIELRSFDVPRNVDFAEDGRMLFTTRDMKRRIIPVVKFSEHFGVGCHEDTYVSCDFNSSPFIKGCIDYQIKLRTQELSDTYETEKDWASRLKNSLVSVKQAPWLLRLKWLFTGVRVDV